MDHMLAITHNYWVYVYLDDLQMQNDNFCKPQLCDQLSVINTLKYFRPFHKIKMRGWNNYIYYYHNNS